MALNLSQTKNFSLQSLKESKIVANTTNGGFDEATWGKLDVTKWQGSVQDGVYQLTNYTGDFSHIIVPNEADFEKAGKSTNGLQVGITRDTVLSFLSNQMQTIAFSKTNDQKVKAVGTDWSHAFSSSVLSKFDGSSLDVSNVTDMNSMFGGTFMFVNNQISDLTSLSNWDTSKVTDMSYMFNDNEISDLSPLSNWDVSKVTNMRCMFAVNKVSGLTPLANWDTSNVTNMSSMFSNNKIGDLTSLSNWKTSKVTNMSAMFKNNSISDLTPLANWNTSEVTNMYYMFENNAISDLTPLANWDVSKVTGMRGMFTNNPDLIDLRPIANWNISSASPWRSSGLFSYDPQLDLTNINNTKLMQGFLKVPIVLQSTTFITNNADLVKAVIGKDRPTLTNTAKRTIVFNIPNAAPETIVQTINYKAIAPVQVNWPTPPAGHSTMAFVSRETLVPVGSDDPDLANPYSSKIVQTYPIKESDWQLDDSKQNDAIIVNGQVHFKAVKIPYINGYTAHLIKDPVNPNALLVSFIALPQQSQNNQLLQKPIQTKQNQPEPIQTKPANDKQTDQIIDHISYTLMHDSLNVDNFEPAQNDPAPLEAPSDSTQKDDAVKIVNTVKPKKRIVKKHVTKKRKKHAKKYHLKRRSRKHAKKRVIKYKKHASKKLRRFHLKRIKRVKH